MMPNCRQGMTVQYTPDGRIGVVMECDYDIARVKFDDKNEYLPREHLIEIKTEKEKRLFKVDDPEERVRYIKWEKGNKLKNKKKLILD